MRAEGRPGRVLCAVLCDEWARAGVTDAVVAPGSRSTPLLAALHADGRFRLSVVLDERAAGFTGVGLGLATGRPAAVVTTSGTASVELHPAVVEAAQGGVPLLAVTTDRPPELHQVGAAQTVEQSALFGSVVRWAYDPGVPDLESARMWRSVASRAVAESLDGPAGPGPIHLNLPFREPLLGRAGSVDAPPGRPDGGPWHRAQPPALGPPDARVVDLLRGAAGGRGLIVAGHGADRCGGAAPVLQLAAALGWPVLADPRSGCRVPSGLVISTADSLLRTPEMSALSPEVILHIGAPWASKVMGQWLAALPADVPQIQVDPWGRWNDPDRVATHHCPTTPAALATGVGPPADRRRVSDWASTWQAAERAARGVVDDLLSAPGPLGLSEPGSPMPPSAGWRRAEPWWSRRRCRSATSSGTPPRPVVSGCSPIAVPTESTGWCPPLSAWPWAPATGRPPP